MSIEPPPPRNTTPFPWNAALGIDLAKSPTGDYAVIVVTERLERLTGRKLPPNPWRDDDRELEDVYVVRHAERFTRGTTFERVVERTGEILRTPELRWAETIYDRTGLGSAVGEMFSNAYRGDRLGESWPVGITFTSGEEQHGLNIPKRQLVMDLLTVAQQGRLQIPENLPLANVMREELREFQLKLTKAGNDTYQARRGHDDTVAALALSICRKNHRVIPRGLNADGSITDRDFTERM